MTANTESRLVVVSDRLRFRQAFEELGFDHLFWGVGSQCESGELLKDLLEDPPDLSAKCVFFIDVRPSRLDKIVRRLNKIYPRIPVFVSRRSVSDKERHGDYYVTDVSGLFDHWVRQERKLAKTRSRVEQLKSVLEDAKEVLILTHPNPDPDAIASALGMRTVLGRNRQTATIGYLGQPLSRPENVAMVELLEVDLLRIEESDLQAYDAIVLVDCQENLFHQYDLPEVAVVVDHHPERSEYRAKFRDVIPEEGSTATIITRYLQSLEIEPSQRLATALLYGIKTDTFFLKREVNTNDIDSFMFLYPRANVNLLRRMEIPELPVEQIQLLGVALQQANLHQGLFMAGMDHVEVEEDSVARLADLGLQAADALWSLAYAVTKDAVVISVRNVGYVRHAGRAVEETFGRFGTAGGHRSAARAIIDKKELEKVLGKAWRKELKDWIRNQFLIQIQPEDELLSKT